MQRRLSERALPHTARAGDEDAEHAARRRARGDGAQCTSDAFLGASQLGTAPAEAGGGRWAVGEGAQLWGAEPIGREASHRFAHLWEQEGVRGAVVSTCMRASRKGRF